MLISDDTLKSRVNTLAETFREYDEQVIVDIWYDVDDDDEPIEFEISYPGGGFTWYFTDSEFTTFIRMIFTSYTNLLDRCNATGVLIS